MAHADKRFANEVVDPGDLSKLETLITILDDLSQPAQLVGRLAHVHKNFELWFDVVIAVWEVLEHAQ